MQRVLLQRADRCGLTTAPKFYSGISEPLPADKCILFRDDYKIRRDIPALPFSKQEKTVRKPLGDKYVSNPITIGQKLRNKRLELGILQKDVAKFIGVSDDTITFWENERVAPQVQYYPKIIQFLGYYPFQKDLATPGGKIRYFRFVKGLSYKKFGKLLGVHSSTLCSWENHKHRPPKKSINLLNFLLKTVVNT